MNHCGRCVDWLIGFQDRWLETTFQIRDDKAYTHSRGDGQRWQEHLSSFCCVLGVLGWMLSFVLLHMCVQKRVHDCITHHTKTEHTTGRL